MRLLWFYRWTGNPHITLLSPCIPIFYHALKLLIFLISNEIFLLTCQAKSNVSVRPGDILLKHSCLSFHLFKWSFWCVNSFHSSSFTMNQNNCFHQPFEPSHHIFALLHHCYSNQTQNTKILIQLEKPLCYTLLVFSSMCSYH